MKVDKVLISKLERLAKLSLSDDEKAKLGSDLERILEMVETLGAVNTEGVEPLVHMNAFDPTLDTVTTPKQDSIRDAAFRNAPKQDGTFFKAPKVIQSKSKTN
jgi:aspartyl-tRNA(Asn)/glutamyl-tRNA(Gln) amidotransferase subunit C